MSGTPSSTPRGPAGAIAEQFLRSKLTPLAVAASLLLGGFALWRLPREEEPQIEVPFFDIFVPFPGASAREVEDRLVATGERRFWEIPGVEFVYSSAEPELALFIVRFSVGTDPEEAAARLWAKTFANLDQLPAGAGQPLVKPRSIDDIPILALTLHGPGADPLALRRAAAGLREGINAIAGVSETALIGGRARRLSVRLDPAALAARRLAPLDLLATLSAANARLGAGRTAGDAPVAVETDALIRSRADLAAVVVGVWDGRPVRLDEVARIDDGPDDEEREVLYYPEGEGAPEPAVTLAVSKRRGENAAALARRVLARVEEAKAGLLPPGAAVAVTRDYGATAKRKSDELIFHLALATLSVTALIALVLGPREALVVLVAIPVTLALTLLVYYLAGYTLNRITLFALIFSIGILVDDAIVVVENIHRHYALGDGRSLWRLSVDAVAEVGNPTILATWAVVAAILPMAFVRGLMGPYMRPIPVGASAAMLLSLLVAFMVSPWAFAHLLELWKPKARAAHRESRLDALYRSFMAPLLASRAARAAYFAAIAALLAGALALVAARAVTVKMLPFDDKDELELILNMPESSPLARTREAADALARRAARIPEARAAVAYVGTAAPYNFNGLVRHYFLRERPYQASVTLLLQGRHERERQSHAIAQSLRPALKELAERYGARLQLAEVPPGPPVLSTLVFEVYGPDEALRLDFARRLRALLRESPGIVDVDAYLPDPQPLARLAVDRPKATLNGLPPAAVVRTARLALAGESAGLAHLEGEREPVEIRLRLAEADRRDLGALERIRLFSANGTAIPLGALVRRERAELEPPRYRKNLRPVSYVIADVSGREESPVYAMLDLRPQLAALARASGIEVAEYFTRQPESAREHALKWDGEWQITYEVFRDLGLAFAMVLALIYVLVVAWFRSFAVPLVIMAPIPLTLVGILPAHWALGAFFTATSMIGFIAGAGIVVRNSIILVDFIELRLREGLPLERAVVDAGAARFRPMLLTAAAVVVGAGVILFDPIFQGLALSLIAGEVASTVLSRSAVPVLYYLYRRSFP